MLDHVLSVNKKIIRLSDERWFHIVENHNEIAGLKEEIFETVFSPDFIAKGITGEFYACKFYKRLGNYLVIIYREGLSEGFVITAFRVRNIKPYLRKEIVWKKQ